ncbi:MAG TPA: STAS domain-containing protein [Verrucomicrobiae bacterium]|nr:STAS domain-containing protein [Verrucomicrobiae bacterium]
MQNLLRVEIERRTPEKPVARLIGRLDSQTYKLAEEHLAPLLGASTTVLILDLSGLTYLNSMGLRVLMVATKTLAKHGGQCVISEPQAGVRAVLEIAKALPNQAVFTSMAEADAYFDAIQKKAKEKAAGEKGRSGTMSL